MSGHKLHKVTRTWMDTIEVTETVADSWEVPPFQRELRETKKVREIGKEIADSGVLPGVGTLGKLTGKPTLYILDGQHRRLAFKVSGLSSALWDVRVEEFDTMGEMAERFVELNDVIRRITSDDRLKAAALDNKALQVLSHRAPFVGYNVAKAKKMPPHAAFLNMSMALRLWVCANNETPVIGTGKSASAMAEELTQAEADELGKALQAMYEAWGRDTEVRKLWGALNLGLCLWLYVRLVLGRSTHPNSRFTRMDRDTFIQCMMQLSTQARYMDWLVNRQLDDTNRMPAYKRIREQVAARYHQVTGKKANLPNPDWYTRGA